jgi:predicted cobalt transporter CbtA
MSKEPTATAEPTTETTATPDQDWGDQDWGKITFCVVLAIIAALGVHYVVFAGMNLSPTVHAFGGMVLFFIAGFVSFSIFY